MSTRSGTLDSSLQAVPIGAETKAEIASRLCDRDCEKWLPRLDCYFKYYTKQSDIALHDFGRHNCARTHRDIVDISRLLKQGLTREEIREYLTSHLPPDRLTGSPAVLDAAINLTIRLLVMLEIGNVPYGFSGYRTLKWEDRSLGDFVASHFLSTQALNSERVKLEKIFIARNLSRIAGIKIIWTDNLAHHLSMTEHDTEVAIFHHASWLEMMRNSTMFPTGFIAETLRTLALLLPQLDKESEQWYKKLASSEMLDTGAVSCGQLRTEDRQIDEFMFWRDRLVILKQVFDESEPSTMSQWWYDRRRGIQRYPFLVAATALVLTVAFGLIQCLEGALQVYASFNQH